MKLMTKTKTKTPPATIETAVSPGRQSSGTATVAQASTTPASSTITTESIASRAYTLWEQA